MRKRVLTAGILGGLATTLVIFLISKRNHDILQEEPKATAKSNASSATKVSSSIPQTQKREPFGDLSLKQIPASVPGKYDPSLPQWQEWRRRKQEDAKWEWKVDISIHGRVLDQNNKPVDSAKVVLSWTDLSSEGSTVSELVTDGQGDFSLSGVRGKHLLVRSIEKQGYVFSVANRAEFEYAAFFDQNYYIPDANSPVVFRMHKTAHAGPLIVVSNKYRIPESGTVNVDLKTGQLGGQDLLIEFTDNSDPTGKKWAAIVRAPSGGLQIARDEFSVLAPESGYQPEVALDQDTPQPTGFQSGSLYKGGRFFVKTPSGYALVEFRMIPGNKSLRFTSYLNPTPGNRNLEFDPAKTVKSP